MSNREVIILGTASQVPTKSRNHNAVFLRWDDLGILFDPGEGTQRQMTYAGLAATQITHIAITHFHGDHCLGLAAILQRISLDKVTHPIEVIYPATGQMYFERLRYSSIYHEQSHIVPRPFQFNKQAKQDPIIVAETPKLKLIAYALDHRVDCFGYRLQEQDSRRMLPEKLEQYRIRDRAIGQLQRQGQITLPSGDIVKLEEVSLHKPGQSFALVMDTRPCVNALKLAQNADTLVCESTYLSTEEEEAHSHYHMTATQAAILAKEAKVKQLILTHFSQRYVSVDFFLKEAKPHFESVIAAKDLCCIPMPQRES